MSTSFTLKIDNLNCMPGYSIIEGTKESLERMQQEYVDVIFAHRADPNGKSVVLICQDMSDEPCDISVPMEEVVRAFNYVIDKGWVCF